MTTALLFILSSRAISFVRIPYRSRLAAHDELQCRPAHDLLVGDITLIIRLSVQLHGLDINILRRDLGSQNRKGLAITYMHLHFREQRGADLILAKAGRPYYISRSHDGSVHFHVHIDRSCLY